MLLLLAKIDWSLNKSFALTTEIVRKVIVCVVCPWYISATLTGMLDGLVSATVGVGDTATTGEEAAVAVAVGVVLGVLVGVAVDFTAAVGLAVAVAVGVVAGVVVAAGVGVEVAGPLVGSEVSGSFASSVWISLILGVTFAGNLVTFTTVTVVAWPDPERGLSVRSLNSTEIADVYFPCKAWVIVFCTLVSIRVFRRTQIFWLPGTLLLLPGITCKDCRLSGLTRAVTCEVVSAVLGRSSILVPWVKSMPRFSPLKINESVPGTITIREMIRNR